MIFALPNKKFIKILFALTAISFLWLGTFGLPYHLGEMRFGNAAGSGCLFNDQMEVCIMDFSEHIALWKVMIIILPQAVGASSLLILALLLVAVIVFWQNNLFEFFEHVASRWRLYIKQNHQVRLFNSLIEEFSQGILHPKIFASATI